MRLIASAWALVFLWGASASYADTVSKNVGFVNEEWIKVGLNAEGVELVEIRFKVQGGIHYNPLRAGSGPQCFVEVKNSSGHETDLAVAIALFDGSGKLVGATESGHTGSLDPGEAAEIKMTFREVHRRMYEAKTVHVVLETWK